MKKFVSNFSEFLAENVKFDVHGYNKTVRDSEFKELRDMGIVGDESAPNHHKYLTYLKMEVDNAKRLMDSMDYDTAIMALEEAEDILKMLKTAVEKAMTERDDEAAADEPEEIDENGENEERKDLSMKEYWDLVQAGAIKPPDFDDQSTLPNHAKVIKWLQKDAKFMEEFIKDGNFKMVKHYVDEMEWLLSIIKKEAYDAAEEYSKENP